MPTTISYYRNVSNISADSVLVPLTSKGSYASTGSNAMLASLSSPPPREYFLKLAKVLKIVDPSPSFI